MITLTLASHQLSAELLYEESLQLIHTLQTESDIQAELPQPGTQAGAKGDPVTIGTIALTFISSGAAVALFKIIEAYLSKNSSLDFELEKARSGLRMGHGEIKDHMFLDGLEDAKTGRLMGSFAQEVADKEGLSREAMDEFAITSLQRAQQAIADGSFQDEIVPVTITTRKGEMVVAEDEQPGNANLEKIPTLRAAFSKDGTITAANASSISDGASALVLMRESVASAKGLAPLARIVAHTTQSQHPSEFTLAPVGSLEKLFAKTGWSAADVDLFEINEAFAMVTMLAMQKHNIPHDKVNVHGGACALGHPIGSTGSRIILSLIHALKQRGGKRGVASLCIGGGEATSMAIELI